MVSFTLLGVLACAAAASANTALSIDAVRQHKRINLLRRRLGLHRRDSTPSAVITPSYRIVQTTYLVCPAGTSTLGGLSYCARCMGLAALTKRRPGHCNGF